MSKEVTLPSGSKLIITLASFKEAKELRAAIFDEAKGLGIFSTDELNVNLYKNIICSLVASKRIDDALNACMKRVVYNGHKINEDTFEAEEARVDYDDICFEVAKANLLPLVKSLYAKLMELMGAMKSFLA